MQKQVKDTKRVRKSWNKTIVSLLNHKRSRLLEAMLTLTIKGHTLPQVCKILGLPYYATVKVLRTHDDIRLLIKRARKHRAIDKRERNIKDISIELKGLE